MVDRPIKKSDREAAQQANPSDDQPKAARNTPKPVKKSDRTDGGTATSDSSNRSGDRNDRGRGGKGKGRGRGKDDAPKTPMNPALMRGPKPTKKVEEVVETAAEETLTEEAAIEEATAEGTSTEATSAEAAVDTDPETAEAASSATDSETEA